MIGIKRNGGITPIILSDKNTLFPPGPAVDPVLENNSWATIKAVCQAGEAANYWALGDEKIIAIDGVGNVPHAIVDMSANRYEYTNNAGVYTSVVFQAVPLIGNYVFNSDSNTSPNGDTAYNGWDYSDLRTSMNSGTIYGLYDSSFTALLEQVKTMAAYSGKTDTLVYSNDKLFIPAGREVKANYTDVPNCEVNSSQTQYGFYAQNSDANANRIKNTFGTSTPSFWWLRSPYINDTNPVGGVRGVRVNGDVNYSIASNSRGVAPCFAF